MVENILHSKIYGTELQSTPLLIFHGLLGLLDNWGTFGREMGKYYPTHLLDLRNHGKSFRSDSMTHDDMSNDILNYMEAHHLEKVNLLGHSLGGKAVMQFAINHPEKVNQLIVVDIAPKQYPPHHQAIFNALSHVDFNQDKTRQDVETTLAKYIKERPIIQFLVKNLYYREENILDWRFNLKALTENYNNSVSKATDVGIFEGKTLFIKGGKSNYILPEDKILIKNEFPNSEIVEISNAGHWVQVENPKDFEQAVKNFLLN